MYILTKIIFNMTLSCQQIAVWIDEILTESDDRMLMMDFDEDDGMLIYYNNCKSCTEA